MASPNHPFPLENTTSMHVNVMEALVYQEIQKQLKFYPKNLKSYINLTEVATFALNRLPPLYASSVKGQEEQENIASLKYRKEINSAVRRAIAAVERDPLRNSTPIISEIEVKYQEAEKTLGAIQSLLADYNLMDYAGQQITWENCPHLLRKALHKLTTQTSPPPPPIPKSRITPKEASSDPKSTMW